MTQSHPRVALVAIRDSALSLDEVVAAVSGPAHGGVVTFSGAVRNHDHASDGSRRPVDRLEYSAHPSAHTALFESCERIADAHPDVVVAAVHRTGPLELGDLAVVLAVGAPHRGAAFAACQGLIDDLKASVPIWKHQSFSDGTDEWVGLP